MISDTHAPSPQRQLLPKRAPDLMPKQKRHFHVHGHLESNPREEPWTGQSAAWLPLSDCTLPTGEHAVNFYLYALQEAT